MMKKIWFAFIAMVCFSVSSFAQNSKGIIHYQRNYKWIKVLETLPYMSQADIDRDKLTSGKSKGFNSDYYLYFDNDRMSYFPSSENDGSRRSKGELILQHDFKTKRVENFQEVLGKKYVVREQAPKIKWKVKNEIKEIAGYLCMKAVTRDTLFDREIVAWFTDQIPVSGGPEGYYGLPGMILELVVGNGAVTIQATNVDFDSDIEVPTPSTRRVKEISTVELNEKRKTYYENQVGMKRNPFWQLRY